MSNSDWEKQRMFCANGHVFDFKDVTGNIGFYRCPTCGMSAKFIVVPYEFDKYLYVNSDQKYF